MRTAFNGFSLRKSITTHGRCDASLSPVNLLVRDSSGSFNSGLPVKYPLLLTGSLHSPFSVQCQTAMRSSVLLR
jgi:hypothetical protein